MWLLASFLSLVLFLSVLGATGTRGHPLKRVKNKVDQHVASGGRMGPTVSLVGTIPLPHMLPALTNPSVTGAGDMMYYIGKKFSTAGHFVGGVNLTSQAVQFTADLPMQGGIEGMDFMEVADGILVVATGSSNYYVLDPFNGTIICKKENFNYGFTASNLATAYNNQVFFMAQSPTIWDGVLSTFNLRTCAVNLASVSLNNTNAFSRPQFSMTKSGHPAVLWDNATGGTTLFDLVTNLPIWQVKGNHQVLSSFGEIDGRLFLLEEDEENGVYVVVYNQTAGEITSSVCSYVSGHAFDPIIDIRVDAGKIFTFVGNNNNEDRGSHLGVQIYDLNNCSESGFKTLARNEPIRQSTQHFHKSPMMMFSRDGTKLGVWGRRGNYTLFDFPSLNVSKLTLGGYPLGNLPHQVQYLGDSDLVFAYSFDSYGGTQTPNATITSSIEAATSDLLRFSWSCGYCSNQPLPYVWNDGGLIGVINAHGFSTKEVHVFQWSL